jgi:hypothetical protein
MKRQKRALVVLASAFLPLAAAAQTQPQSHEGLVPRMGRWVTPEQAAAEPALLPVVAAPDWGTSGTSSYTVGPCDASSRDDTLTFSAADCDDVRPIGSGTDIAFPLHLPAGALVTSATLYYYDDSGTDPSIGLYGGVPGTKSAGLMSLSPPAFNGGNNVVTFLAAPPFTIDNTSAYVVLAILSAGHRIQGIRFDYKLQVSPAPATATFNDVPTSHPFFQFVEALAASGITAGCGGGKFCPDQPLTRGQMAVFLSKALGLYFPN